MKLPKVSYLMTFPAIAFALVLTGCGGGSSSDSGVEGAIGGMTPPSKPSTPPTKPPTVTPPTEPTTVAVTITDGMYLDEDKMPTPGTTEIGAGDSYTSGGVIFSCPSDGEACEITVEAAGTATSTGGKATAMLTDEAVLQVAKAKKDEQDAADVAALEMRDRIIGWDRAVEGATNILTTPGVISGTLEEDDITINRAAGAMASVTVADPSGYSPADDPALSTDGWAGSHLTRSVTGVGMQHLFVYTDIEEPTRVQFYNFDGDPATPWQYSSTLDSATEPADSTSPIDGLLLIEGIAPLNAATLDLTRFPEPGPVEGGDIKKTYLVNTDSTGGDGDADIVSLPGNYNGAGGRYHCTPTGGGPCSASVTPGGVYTLGGGDWTFVPELNATAWQQDQEFMSFGWWLQVPTAATGTYTFEHYADGTAYLTPAVGVNLAAGSATYNGRAAGEYVDQEIDDTGVTGGRAGRFVAAASLTASFTGMGANGSLSGTISDFDGEHDGMSDWAVTLNSQTLFTNPTDPLTSLGLINSPTVAGFDGSTAIMGDQTAHGTWSSEFFGQPATINAYPLGVGGVFKADNEKVSIAGAFGARR